MFSYSGGDVYKVSQTWSNRMVRLKEGWDTGGGVKSMRVDAAEAEVSRQAAKSSDRVKVGEGAIEKPMTSQRLPHTCIFPIGSEQHTSLDFTRPPTVRGIHQTHG